MASGDRPHIRFFSGSRDQRIAYALAGEGPALILPAWWVSHVERDFADKRFRSFFEELAAHHTVIRYDRPGVGLSVRERREWSLEAEVAQLEALVEHLGLERLALLGFSCGAPAAVAFAARHPERVSHVVLVAAYAYGPGLAARELQKAVVDLTRASWGLGSRTLSDLMAPDLSKEEVIRIAKDQRASCSPEVAARLLQLTFELDCRSQAARLALPTLVIHRREDRTIRIEAGRELASIIPDADFQVLDGDAHVPWQGNQEPMLDAVLGFLGERGTAARAPAPSTDPCLWRREGDLWRLRFAGHEVMLGHRKGLEDLAILLAHPMREISATELREGFDPPDTAPATGADEMLDDRARAQYAERIRDLEAELADAEACNDLGRLEGLQTEKESLLQHLNAARGLGGRARRLGDPAERARKAVSARIRDAVKRVGEVHPVLAEHLDASLSTGLKCVYRPETVELWRS